MSWRDNYRQPISGKVSQKRLKGKAISCIGTNSRCSSQSIADRLGLFVQAHTLYSSVRPLGAGTIIGSYLEGEATLHMIEPSGVYWVCLSMALMNKYV